MMEKLRKLLRNRAVIAAALPCAAALVVLVVALAAILPRTLAWFASNKNVSGGGMSLSAAEDYLRFADTFSAGVYMPRADGTVVTVTPETTFTRDKTSGNYADGEGKTLSLDSLFPGEYIEMNFRVTCSPGRRTGSFCMYFSGLGESERFDVGGVEYSILGVYRLEVSVNGGEWSDRGYLASYGETPTYPDTVDILRDEAWPDGMGDDDYVSVSVRLYVDLGQYNRLEGRSSNLLSNKTVTVSAIVLAPEEGQ